MHTRLLLILLLTLGAVYFGQSLQQMALCGAGGIVIAGLVYYTQRKVRQNENLYALNELLGKNVFRIKEDLELNRQEAVAVLRENDVLAYEKLREISVLLRGDRISRQRVALLHGFQLRKDMYLELEQLLLKDFEPLLAEYIGEIAKVRPDLIKDRTLRYVKNYEVQILGMDKGLAILTAVAGAAVRLKRYALLYSGMIGRYVQELPKDRFLRLSRLIAASPYEPWNGLDAKVAEIRELKYRWDPEKVLGIDDKIQAVREAGRLYAAGDLIAAENQYRLAAANTAIMYKEDLIAARLQELAPITAIRSSLSGLVLTLEDQLTVKDFAGYMESYASLLSLKSKYMTQGGPYEVYYRQLSADSGISEKMTAGFRQFREQFLAELAESQNGSGSTGSGDADSFKWSLLQIPDAYYGGTAAKEELLAAKFQAHDTARLKALAAAGSFQPMLDSALSMEEAYKSHSYTAAWVEDQVQESATLILNKDLDGDRAAAFAGHAVAYRSYAASAGLQSSKVLKLIDNSTTRLLRDAARLVRGGQFAEAIQLYGELNPLQDTSEAVAAATLAWNTAEPVRLLPGGDVQGSYSLTASVTGHYGAKVAVAGVDSTGRLVYAEMSDDGIISTRTGDIIPDAAALTGLSFDDALSAYSEVPVVVATGSREDGRSTFTGYTIRPEGISRLFSFAGSDYELMAEDSSIRVTNTDLADGTDNETAIFRQVNGVYEFSEIYRESTYILIDASQLELHPFEKVTLSCNIYTDSAGRTVASSNGRYLILQGEVGAVTGSAYVGGQFENGYDYAETDTGEQYLPVFIVDTVGSLSVMP
ncbi:hypothetical protein KC345_g10326 [Hortaea werneckii]|nr:hypothetical protein KC345_g10326 [Hortaea werneckii]